MSMQCLFVRFVGCVGLNVAVKAFGIMQVFFGTKLGTTDAGAALQYKDCLKRLRHKPVA